LSVATTTSAGLSLPETKSTGFDCGQTQADTGELLGQTGLRLGQQQVGGLHLIQHDKQSIVLLFFFLG